MVPNLVTIDNFSYPYLVVANEDPQVVRLNDVITTYQNDLFEKILGAVELTNFANDFTSPAIIPNSTLWQEFITGSNWTKTRNKQTFTVKYQGIKEAIVRYIYYYYNLAIQTAKMQSGEGAVKFQNAEQVVPHDLVRGAWNSSIELIGFNWIDGFAKDDLEEFKPSVFNYLYENEALLPNWEFTQEKKINFLGI